MASPDGSIVFYFAENKANTTQFQRTADLYTFLEKTQGMKTTKSVYDRVKKGMKDAKDKVKGYVKKVTTTREEYEENDSNIDNDDDVDLMECSRRICAMQPQKATAVK